MAPLPLVSVVIPSFNHARYLRESLGSVHAQDWPSLESIVVDDGSGDDTAAVARGLGASIVVRQTNQGLSRARNAGLAAAHGEYVLFLDADDRLLPHAVRSGVAVLEQHPAAAVVGRQCRVMDGDGRALHCTPPVFKSADLYAELLGMNFVWTPGAALFRREAIAAIGGFPEAHPAAADYAVLLELARRGRLLFDAHDVVWYRKHESNMSRDAMLMLRAVLWALERERSAMAPEYRCAFMRGQRRWREFYGEQLTMDLRREWRVSRRPAKLVAGGLFLWRYCTRLAAMHVLRKLSRVARRLPPAELEPPPTVSAYADPVYGKNATITLQSR
jgi:glycosyltransferase involved in cell wall biosynthesis